MISKTLDRIQNMRRIPSEPLTDFKRRLEAELDYLRSKKCREWETDEAKAHQQYKPRNAGAYTIGINGWQVCGKAKYGK